MKTCPHCGFENEEDEQICVRCGLLMQEAEPGTRTLDDADDEDGTPKWGSARFNNNMSLQLDVLETSQRFIFEGSTITKIEVGRIDPRTGQVPDVDLSPSKGLEKGVSRHHANVICQDGALHLVDKNSANGTYLNGQRLIADQPRILRDGDDIRLGRLVMRVTFRPTTSSLTNMQP